MSNTDHTPGPWPLCICGLIARLDTGLCDTCLSLHGIRRGEAGTATEDQIRKAREVRRKPAKGER